MNRLFNYGFNRTTLAPLVGLTLLAGFVLAPSLAPGQAREIKLDVPVGTTMQFSQDLGMNMDVNLNMQGQQMQMQGNSTDRLSGQMKVLESPNGTPTKVEVTFDPNLGAQKMMMGQQQNAPFALAGQTVTLTKTPGGVTIEPNANVDPITREKVAGLLDFTEEMLPDRPVAPGDTWKPNMEGLLGPDAETTGESTLTLVRYLQHDGRDAAEVSMVGDLAGNMQGMQTNGDLNGTMFLDTQTGLMLDGDLRGDLEVSGNQIQGQPTQVDGTVTMNMTGTTDFIGTVPAGNNNGNNANNANNNRGGDRMGDAVTENATDNVTDEVDEATRPANPGANVLAGTYGDGQMTLEIAEGNNPAVKIIRGTNTYDGKITSQTGASFSGNFKAGTNTFPFSGSRSPDGSLTFQSGSSTYNLKKQGTPAPANPLEQ